MNSLTLCWPMNGLVSSVRAERLVIDRQTQPTWRSELVRISALLGAVHEARILLEEISGTNFATLVLRLDEPIPSGDLEKLTAHVTSRADAVPLQHIVGHWP